ncbi:DUF6069 family protein [Salinibaculum salinum]|uniref:DUF6069 family protein n=1 Tax=Salinibaculum salinum TaxID=3131996 RepID=UPI0030EB706D
MIHNTKTIALRGVAAAAVSALVNAGIVAGAQSVDLAPGFRALTYPPVLFLSVAGALGAAVVYALLARRDGRGTGQTFTRIAVAVLVLSFVPDIGLLVADDAATTSGVVVLMAMHVVVAAVSVSLLTGRPVALGGSEATTSRPR